MVTLDFKKVSRYKWECEYKGVMITISKDKWMSCYLLKIGDSVFAQDIDVDILIEKAEDIL